MSHEHYLIGRQPILDRGEEIKGFELLFRSDAAWGFADVGDASQATAQVIVTTLSGIESILGPHRGFINLDFNLLMSDVLEILPRERVVLELLETLSPTPDVVQRCRELKAGGFTLALDDHLYSPAFEELYRIVDIVKLDVQQVPDAGLEEMVHHLRAYPVCLLAEKVQSRAEYRRCLDLGFELFQGYYFSEPVLMEKRRFDDAGAVLLKLMYLLNEDAELDLIEQAFRSSPGLTYKLLLLMNSVLLGLREKIHTVRHAVVVLGRQQIRRWVQLALFASDDLRGPENPLVDMAAVRGALMEQLALCLPARHEQQHLAEKAFMVGILSLLEVIYRISMDEVVASVALSEDVRDALISRTGDLGTLLEATEMIERLEFAPALERLVGLGITRDDLRLAQVKAYSWREGMHP